MLLSIKQYYIFKPIFKYLNIPQQYLLCYYYQLAIQHYAYLPYFDSNMRDKLSHCYWFISPRLQILAESNTTEMKHFLGSTETIVAPNYSPSIRFFGCEGQIWINPIEFKCLDLNLLSKKLNGGLKNKLYGKRVCSID